MPKFLPGIHGLRAVAALSVLLFHLVRLAPDVKLPPALFFINSHFGLGVQLFFVLSAFSLAHSTYHRTEEPDWLRSYLVKRFFRIAPLFYFMIAFFTIYDLIVWKHVHPRSEYVLNLLFLHNFVPGKHESMVWAGWTIGVEMIFYVMFPAVLVLARGVTSALVLFVMACAAGVAAAILLSVTPGIPKSYVYMSFVRATPAFAAGFLAFQVYRLLQRGNVDPRFIKLGGAVATMSFAAAAWFVPLDPLRRFDLIFWVLAFASLCVWQAAAPGRILGSRPLQFLGERSYSIYLVHAIIVFRLAPAYGVIFATLPEQFGTLAFFFSAFLAGVLVVTVASVTYKFIEAPCIRIGARFARSPRTASQPRLALP